MRTEEEINQELEEDRAILKNRIANKEKFQGIFCELENMGLVISISKLEWVLEG